MEHVMMVAMLKEWMKKMWSTVSIHSIESWYYGSDHRVCKWKHFIAYGACSDVSNVECMKRMWSTVSIHSISPG